MEMIENSGIELLSRKSIVIKDYEENCDENGEDQVDQNGDRASLKIDLSMAEQFYYEVISSIDKDQVFQK